MKLDVFDQTNLKEKRKLQRAMFSPNIKNNKQLQNCQPKLKRKERTRNLFAAQPPRCQSMGMKYKTQDSGVAKTEPPVKIQQLSSVLT